MLPLLQLGLYEHQSASAIHGLLALAVDRPELQGPGIRQHLKQLTVKIYEPAFSIIGDPAKRNPTVRGGAEEDGPGRAGLGQAEQSAD